MPKIKIDKTTKKVDIEWERESKEFLGEEAMEHFKKLIENSDLPHISDKEFQRRVNTMHACRAFLKGNKVRKHACRAKKK